MTPSTDDGDGDRAARPAKQRAIVAAGRALFLRDGVRRSRVEAICAEAEVSKRTFYRYYRDKEALALDVLLDLADEAHTRLDAVLSRPRPVAAAVREIMEVKTAMAAETSAVLLGEALDGSTALGRRGLELRRDWDLRVRAFYAEARERGEIRTDVDLDLLMALVARVRDLVGDPELQRLAPSLAELVRTVMSVVLDGLLPRADS